MRKRATLGPKLLTCWLFVVGTLLVQRPLSSPNLWWDLSCGREVRSWTDAAAQSRLILGRDNTADWLGGFLHYLIWLLGGTHLLSAVPLMCALAILSATCWRSLKQPDIVVFVPLFLWTSRAGLQPGEVLFDLLGLLVLARLINPFRAISSPMLVVLTFLTFVAWANFGVGLVWGLLWLLCTDWQSMHNSMVEPKGSLVADSRSRVRSRATICGVFAAALLGGMLTPRAILTWRDSLILLSPMSFADTHQYGEATWQGLFSAGPWTTSEYAFVAMWCLWGFRYVWSQDNKNCRASAAQKLTRLQEICIPMVLASLNRGNTPMGGLWILLAMCNLNRSRFAFTPLGSPPLSKAVTPVFAFFVLFLTLVDASGRGIAPRGRLGWGIAQEIDPRMLDVKLAGAPNEELVGWAADARSAGIASWLYPNLRLVDHPKQALLGNRTAVHNHFIDDVRGAHRARYRREDGTWGGYVHQLGQWNVDVIFLPVEMVELNRDFEATTWTSLDLDSPTVPFVSTDDARYAAEILGTIRQTGFVEVGPWQPGADVYDSLGGRYDAIRPLGAGPDSGPAIRQSMRFRALNLPLASLRALLPVRQFGHQPKLQLEFFECQTELAYQEWSTFGQVSKFRMLVMRSLVKLGLTPKTSSLDQLAYNSNSRAEIWKRCVDHYLAGDVRAAITALPQQTKEPEFAAVMLWLELGETRKAQEALQPLLTASGDSFLGIAAAYWAEQIALFDSP